VFGIQSLALAHSGEKNPMGGQHVVVEMELGDS
jgi:hypothetical protein